MFSTLSLEWRRHAVRVRVRIGVRVKGIRVSPLVHFLNGQILRGQCNAGVCLQIPARCSRGVATSRSPAQCTNAVEMDGGCAKLRDFGRGCDLYRSGAKVFTPTRFSILSFEWGCHAVRVRVRMKGLGLKR